MRAAAAAPALPVRLFRRRKRDQGTLLAALLRANHSLDAVCEVQAAIVELQAAILATVVDMGMVLRRHGVEVDVPAEAWDRLRQARERAAAALASVTPADAPSA